MPLSEREIRLKFLGLSDCDMALMKALRPLFEQHVTAVVDAFYEHLLEFPDTARILRDRTTVERLKSIQRTYLLRMTEGNFDESYFADRVRIGMTHERIGLLPRWYLLAYNHYFKLLAPLILHHYAQEPGLAYNSVVALEKVFVLDASLALDAYMASDRYRHFQELESIVNDSADVIFTLDSEKRIRSWNLAAQAVFGWTASETIGQRFDLLMPPELLAAGEMELIDNEVAENGHMHLETVRLAKDGRRVPVAVSVSALRDPQGFPIGRCAILRDITERRRFDDEKLRAERLAVIGAMSARLAHEIRNPLSSITLNLDLLQDEINTLAHDRPEKAGEARTLLTSINAEVRRIQAVTEDYLQFARMPKPQRKPVFLNEVITHGLSFMQSLFDASGVQAQPHLDSELPAIQGDENQLWQAMLNLIRNAVEAMPKGGTLTVTTTRTETGVRLAVSDTGKGMSEADRLQVFKPFFSTKPSGTGLGLPLTQQIIVEHGGSIRFESAENRGTTFVIELPFK
jgi:PAS domain S-box-containing protein